MNKAPLMIKSTLSLMVIAFILSACAGSSSNNSTAITPPETPSSVQQAATKVFYHGAIYTVNDQQPWAQAIAIKANKIVFVGTDDEVTQYIGSNTQVVDLKGKMLMPGIHDVHLHPIESASDNTQFTLAENQLDAEQFIPAIQQASQQNPNSEWLIGYGHSVSALLEASRSPLAIIDEAESERPVIIMEQTSHSMWLNSKALQLAGFNEQSDNPIGGVLGRDVNGKLNGILYDNAGMIVMDQALASIANLAENDYLGLTEYTLPKLAQYGITSICDARSFWLRDDQQTWLKAEQNNALTVRVNVGLWAYPELDDSTQLAELAKLYQNDAERLVKFNQIKLYADGITSNTTAAVFEPYQIDILGLNNNNGVNYFSQQRLTKYIQTLAPLGFDFHIHGIGERGIHESLNAIEQAGKAGQRHRITHVEMVSEADLPRFAELNITADAQVAGDFTQPEHWHEMDELVGAVRADNAVPINSLQQAGARVTLSSDWNVSSLNPFVGLQHAVTRAPQALSLAQAIKAYTINGAYVMRQEQQLGSLEVGKIADFIVLDRNLFEIEPNNINQTQVLQTVFNGEIIYQQ